MRAATAIARISSTFFSADELPRSSHAVSKCESVAIIGEAGTQFKWECKTLNCRRHPSRIEMQYEVEQKFRLSDLPGIDEKLRQLGAVDGPTVVQVDCYFRHPSRDFAQTDEALRIRTV